MLFALDLIYGYSVLLTEVVQKGFVICSYFAGGALCNTLMQCFGRERHFSLDFPPTSPQFLRHQGGDGEVEVGASFCAPGI